MYSSRDYYSRSGPPPPGSSRKPSYPESSTYRYPDRPSDRGSRQTSATHDYPPYGYPSNSTKPWTRPARPPQRSISSNDQADERDPAMNDYLMRDSYGDRHYDADRDSREARDYRDSRDARGPRDKREVRERPLLERERDRDRERWDRDRPTAVPYRESRDAYKEKRFDSYPGRDGKPGDYDPPLRRPREFSGPASLTGDRTFRPPYRDDYEPPHRPPNYADSSSRPNRMEPSPTHSSTSERSTSSRSGRRGNDDLFPHLVNEGSQVGPSSAPSTTSKLDPKSGNNVFYKSASPQDMSKVRSSSHVSPPVAPAGRELKRSISHPESVHRGDNYTDISPREREKAEKEALASRPILAVKKGASKISLADRLKMSTASASAHTKDDDTNQKRLDRETSKESKEASLELRSLSPKAIEDIQKSSVKKTLSKETLRESVDPLPPTTANSSPQDLLLVTSKGILSPPKESVPDLGNKTTGSSSRERTGSSLSSQSGSFKTDSRKPRVFEKRPEERSLRERGLSDDVPRAPKALRERERLEKDTKPNVSKATPTFSKDVKPNQSSNEQQAPSMQSHDPTEELVPEIKAEKLDRGSFENASTFSKSSESSKVVGVKAGESLIDTTMPDAPPRQYEQVETPAAKNDKQGNGADNGQKAMPSKPSKTSSRTEKVEAPSSDNVVDEFKQVDPVTQSTLPKQVTSITKEDEIPTSDDYYSPFESKRTAASESESKASTDLDDSYEPELPTVKQTLPPSKLSEVSGNLYAESPSSTRLSGIADGEIADVDTPMDEKDSGFDTIKIKTEATMDPDVSVQFPLNRLEQQLYDLEHLPKSVVQKDMKYFSARPIKSLSEYPFYHDNMKFNDILVHSVLLSRVAEHRRTLYKDSIQYRKHFKELKTVWIRYCDELERKQEQPPPPEPETVAPPAPIAPEPSGRSGRRGRDHGDSVRSEAEFLEILANFERESARDPSVRAKLTSVAVPDLIYDPIERDELRYQDANNFIEDKSIPYQRLTTDPIDTFSPEEHDLFCDAYSQWPKQFGKIANVIGTGRTFNDCVMHYYITKKEVDYKTMVLNRARKSSRKSRKKVSKEKSSSRAQSEGSVGAVPDGSKSNPQSPNPTSDSESVAKTEEVERKRVLTEVESEKKRSKKVARSGTAASSRRGAKKVEETEYSEHTATPSLPSLEVDTDASASLQSQSKERSSSYWSAPETNLFQKLLLSYGSDWDKISKHFKTKSSAMVKNYFLKNADSKGWSKLANGTDERIRKGQPVPLPPALPDEKRNKLNVVKPSGERSPHSAQSILPTSAEAALMSALGKKMGAVTSVSQNAPLPSVAPSLESLVQATEVMQDQASSSRNASFQQHETKDYNTSKTSAADSVLPLVSSLPSASSFESTVREGFHLPRPNLPSSNSKRAFHYSSQLDDEKQRLAQESERKEQVLEEERRRREHEASFERELLIKAERQREADDRARQEAEAVEKERERQRFLAESELRERENAKYYQAEQQRLRDIEERARQEVASQKSAQPPFIAPKESLASHERTPLPSIYHSESSSRVSVSSLTTNSVGQPPHSEKSPVYARPSLPPSRRSSLSNILNPVSSSPGPSFSPGPMSVPLPPLSGERSGWHDSKSHGHYFSPPTVQPYLPSPSGITLPKKDISNQTYSSIFTPSGPQLSADEATAAAALTSAATEGHRFAPNYSTPANYAAQPYSTLLPTGYNNSRSSYLPPPNLGRSEPNSLPNPLPNPHTHNPAYDMYQRHYPPPDQASDQSVRPPLSTTTRDVPPPVYGYDLSLRESNERGISNERGAPHSTEGKSTFTGSSQQPQPQAPYRK